MTTRIDADALKARIDLVDVIGQTVQLRRSGANWVGFCPFHDNRHSPALAVFPATQTWRCFGACNDGGDVFAWVMKRDRSDFRSALASLDDGIHSPAPAVPPSPVVPAVEPAPAPPNAVWQARAREFMAECQQALEDTAGVMRYLQGPRRLLSTRTIREAQLGFNREGRKERGELWGLAPDQGDVWLPAGIVIPGVSAGAVWYLKVRQPQGKTPKYLHIKRPRQSVALYNADRCRERRVVALTEGEFDCLLLQQECDDLCGVGTLGAQGNQLGDWLFRYLADAEVILAIYDADGKSEKGLANLAAKSRKVHRVNLPGGKDVTEYAAAGGRLFGWLNAARREALAAQFPTQQAHMDHIQHMLALQLPVMLRADYGVDLIELQEGVML